MKSTYPVLDAERAARGISKKAIYSKLGITARSYYNKTHGISPLGWNEACVIQTTFFPDVSKDKLFANNMPET